MIENPIICKQIIGRAANSRPYIAVRSWCVKFLFKLAKAAAKLVAALAVIDRSRNCRCSRCSYRCRFWRRGSRYIWRPFSFA